MAEGFLTILLENLDLLIKDKVGLILGVKKEMKRLASTLSTIKAVLEDAERRQLTDRAIKDWLQKLNDLSFELDDVLDDCKAFKLESHGQKGRLSVKVRSSLSSLIPKNVWFRLKIAEKMREIGDRLDEIANERMKFHLTESVGETGRDSHVRERRETSSVVTEPCVYGREERETIIGFLVNDAVKSNDVSVFTIVGLGGLGKTTLAQLVYNDERVKNHFELKMWICVSEDFDVKRLVRGCEQLDMDPLQMRLQGMLRGKRFLLVLDDVWNEDQDQWDKLKCVLACGSAGSSLVVTTRTKKVASIMGTVPMHHLSGLSEEDCWSLFKKKAFGSETENKPTLEKIGKEIVKKCKGVPLAAKALGGLMRYKQEESQWVSVMQSELWNLPEDTFSVLPALRLSYFHLSVEQRRCFAYCAVYPKDHTIEKETLIRLWMANGLIYSRRGLEVEDIGNEIFNELCWRSLLQDNEEFGEVKFQMHDLVHDLALSVMGDECCVREVDNDTQLDDLKKRTKHLTCHVRSDNIRIQIPNDQYLRTLQALNFRCNLDLKFSSLRAFHVSFRDDFTPSLISHLKHVRYLNLSNSNYIKILPESVCSLHHLLTLDLRWCTALQMLPKKLSQIKGLRHLYIERCKSLIGMPPSIGRLTRLKTLTDFIVNRKKGHSLDELGPLNIGGSLEIRNLNAVGSSVEAVSAKLSGKMNLKELTLKWDQTEDISQQQSAEQVLKALVPSPNLTTLRIYNYVGVSFPHWLSNEFLGNVTKIMLDGCHNCAELPPLGTLASLRDLSLSGFRLSEEEGTEIFPRLSKLRVENCPKLMLPGTTLASLRNLHLQGLNLLKLLDSSGLKRGYPHLTSISIIDLPNLERLSKEEEAEIFPCLSKLEVRDCPKLMLKGLESVKDLEIHGGTESLLNFISNLCGLTSLCISGNDSLTHLPRGFLENLTTLQSLKIKRFKKLEELSMDSLIIPQESLDIWFCDELKCFTEGLLQNYSLVKCLTITSCKKLKSLSEGFSNLSLLQSLELVDCPELEGFPNSLSHLRSLRNLTMSGINLITSVPYQKLACLPEALQHLPSLEYMAISCFSELASLPEWLGNLESLRVLRFVRCPDLVHIPNTITRLTNLQKFIIMDCPKLDERCKKEAGEDWHKISHIADVYVGPMTNGPYR